MAIATQSDLGSNSRTADFEPSVLLRLETDPPITVSSSGTVVAFNWRAGGTANVVLDVTAADDGDGDETYVVTVQASADQAFTTPINVASAYPLRGITGHYNIQFYGPDVTRTMGVAAEYLRLAIVPAGLTPSITFSSYITYTVAN